jgi:hypothetical protein
MQPEMQQFAMLAAVILAALAYMGGWLVTRNGGAPDRAWAIQMLSRTYVVMAVFLLVWI